LIYMMVSFSFGLNHIVSKHFVWCKSSTSFHNFTPHLPIPLHGWIQYYCDDIPFHCY
jgi:hypothetical protein